MTLAATGEAGAARPTTKFYRWIASELVSSLQWFTSDSWHWFTSVGWHNIDPERFETFRSNRRMASPSKGAWTTANMVN